MPIRYIVLLAALAQLAGAGVMGEMLVYDSLSRVHPRMRARWLAQQGVDLPGYFEPRKPESTGIRMVGKWGRGPSYEVTGRDSFVFLSLGSEVAIVTFANPDSPEVLSEPQAMGLVTQAAVRDSFLFMGLSTGAAGIEIWNISDPRNPVFRNRVLTRLTDFCVRDTFAFVTQRSSPSYDTFKVYNLADPDNPQLVGSCRDSGDVVAVAGNIVMQGDWNDIHAIDVSNPANPRRVGSYPGGPLGLTARGSICCAAIYWTTDVDHFRFEVLDVSTPSNIRRLGYLNDVGGYDIFLAETLAFVSGYQSGGFEFTVADISDSTNPSRVGSAPTRGDNYGVSVNLGAGRAYVADCYEGLTELNISDLGSPSFLRSIIGGDMALDVAVVGTHAFVADNRAGLQLLDVADPTRPATLGIYDTLGFRPMYNTTAASDSFAFVDSRSGGIRFFRTVDVTDPSNPRFAGDCELFNPPEDMVLRDTFVYVAEANRFQVVNVARPRQPVLVGSCVTGDATSAGLCLTDTLAYVGNFVTNVVNVRNPASPQVAGQFGRGAFNVAVRDTFAFLSTGGLVVYSVADPAHPRPLDSLSVGPGTWWIEAVGSLLYLANRDGVRVVDASDVHNMQVLGFAATPFTVKRVTYKAPYIYAVCWDAGVCIFESTQVAVSGAQNAAHRRGALLVRPNPVRARATLAGSGGSLSTQVIRDVAGRPVPRAEVTCESSGEARLDLTNVPPGVYFVEDGTGPGAARVKFVKQ